ncbi:M24 family metallopeptidase [Williamsia phyllosphaerae]|uniref:X-Pro dipeptidase n=1 Tax=Williamsia phyllosphaerae TaxID=885042 RepID=A0ABQ1V6M5_9NOCA|nr:aminopeptidase P family protein [Williamsia phyllosphaerae]GGF41480.1 X-Pro dipeptidase [Williamsia phyllosphaerae]
MTALTPSVTDPHAAHQARRDLLRVHIATLGADAAVIGDLVNVRYLTGFTGSNAALLVSASAEGDRICTDGRYVTQVGEQVPDVEAVIGRDCPGTLLDLVAPSGPTVAVEEHALTVTAWRALTERTEGAQPPVRLVALGRAVENLRMVKDDGEVELLRQACQAADVALATIIERGVIAPGQTERQVARSLEWEMYACGADDISFETIVAAGANSAVPHHRPTDAILATGDFVKIDFGAVVGGYHSDMTRTYVLGSAADWQHEIYELVAAAQAAGRAALSPDAPVVEVDAAARSVIDDAGYGENYVHGLGHGVGLEIHEAPGIGKLGTGTLPCGAAVTVEPGVYLPGRGGVRIEDTLVVRAGAPELLTTTDKTFSVI